MSLTEAREQELVRLIGRVTDLEARLAVPRGAADHGELSGLADDDHTQYLLADGTRQVDGNLTIDNTNREALLVRKNADGGNVFVVDTTNDEIEIPTGSIKLVSTTTSVTGIIFKGADRFIHDFQHPTGGGAVPIGNNTFIGDRAGNFTMGATATQAWFSSGNTGVGYRTLASLTTGYSNMAVGAESLSNATTGYSNVGIGAEALKLLVSGSSNVAIGTGALKLCTGSYNVAIGMEALIGVTSGVSNVAIGRRAGRYIADGSTANTTSDYSIYIGRLTKAGADNNQNEIVIGYNAIGAGSNTATIGNTSLTRLHCPPITIPSTALLGTPAAGTIEFYGGRFYITNVAHQRVIDRTSDVAVATVTVENTIDETTIWTGVMNANGLVAGNVFKFHADGVVDSASNSDLVTLRVKINGVTKATLVQDTKQMVDDHWHIDANATQRTIGAAGSRAIHVHLEIDELDTYAIGVAAIDTTDTMDVTLTAQWSNADAGNIFQLYQAFMEYKN